jgi:hypothetical protein
MSSFPETLVLCDTRLALIAETAGNFNAQLLDLTRLRDQVRKAEQSALKSEARKSADGFVLSGFKPAATSLISNSLPRQRMEGQADRMFDPVKSRSKPRPLAVQQRFAIFEELDLFGNSFVGCELLKPLE